jgi:hypothetical protein
VVERGDFANSRELTSLGGGNHLPTTFREALTSGYLSLFAAPAMFWENVAFNHCAACRPGLTDLPLEITFDGLDMRRCHQ